MTLPFGLALATLILIFLFISAVFVTLTSVLPRSTTSQFKLFSWPETLWERIKNDTVTLSLVIFVLALLLIVGFLLIKTPNNWGEFADGILVEMVGMLFDIILLVLLFNWINAKGEKKRRVERYQEELNDYRGWFSDEARHRVIGILERLEKEDAEIDFSYLHLGKAKPPLILRAIKESKVLTASLSHATLKWADLKGLQYMHGKLSHSSLWYSNFEKADLFSANFTHAELMHCNFQRANLTFAKFQQANLQNASLQHANLFKANFQQAVLYKADLQYAECVEVNFSGANLQEADLSHTSLQRANFLKADLTGANFEGADIRNIIIFNAKVDNIRLKGAWVESKDWHIKIIFKWPQELGQLMGRFYTDDTPHLDDNGKTYYLLKENINHQPFKPKSK